MCPYSFRVAFYHWQSHHRTGKHQLTPFFTPERGTHRNFRVTVPLLEAPEALQAKERPELVHRAHAPFPGLLYAQNLDNPEAGGRPTRAVSTGDFLGRVLQDLREVVVLERTICLALEADNGK